MPEQQNHDMGTIITTHRSEVITGILAQTRREVLDGLYTLAYHAHQMGNSEGLAHLDQAVWHVEQWDKPTRTVTGDDVPF